MTKHFKPNSNIPNWNEGYVKLYLTDNIEVMSSNLTDIRKDVDG